MQTTSGGTRSGVTVRPPSAAKASADEVAAKTTASARAILSSNGRSVVAAATVR